MFRLARNNQHESSLLQLPTELLCKILRMLLRHHDRLPFRLKYASGKYPELPGWIDLSSQMLASCQVLYKEAYHILYRENVVRVCFSRCHSSDSRLFISILHCAAFTINTPAETYPHFYCGGREPFRPDSYVETGFGTLTDTLDLLARFAAIHVEFLKYASYLVASRILRTHLLNKRVVVDLGEPPIITESTRPYWIDRHPNQPNFSPACFAVWQCESVAFQNGCQLECCKSKYTDLAGTIMDKEYQIRDLFVDLWRLDDALSQALESQWEFFPSTQSLLREERKPLTYAIYNSDVRVFNRARQQVMAKTNCALTKIEIDMKGRIEYDALAEILDVEEHLAFDDEERSIWIDVIVSRKEHELATVEEEIADRRRLLVDLIDEDELLDDVAFKNVSNDVKVLDRAFSCPLSCRNI